MVVKSFSIEGRVTTMEKTRELQIIGRIDEWRAS